MFRLDFYHSVWDFHGLMLCSLSLVDGMCDDSRYVRFAVSSTAKLEQSGLVIGGKENKTGGKFVSRRMGTLSTKTACRGYNSWYMAKEKDGWSMSSMVTEST